jgi:poly-gamma-glutamate synthesis protein (capsule biosynthesis protein)
MQSVKLLKQSTVSFGVIMMSAVLTVGCEMSSGAAWSLFKRTPPVILTKPPKPKRYTQEAELMAVGDIMMHGSQIKSGYNPQTKTYNYDRFFTAVQPILSQGDWVIGNLETTLAGAAAKYTGYPLFNAPDPLADAIKNAGFNILTTANNHSLDRGEAGLLKTLENIRSRGLEPVGTDASLAEADDILVVEKNDISMAILAYTYGTNGIPIPKGKNYLVALIDEAKIKADIAQAEQLGVDVITVALHFGSEYQRQPNPQQKQLVENLVAAGADIILGSHPHVVQPYEIFEFQEESGETRQAVAIYSMGNFISNQRGNYKDLGVIFQVKLKKHFPDEIVEITKVDAIPTWVHRYWGNNKYQFRVLPIEATLQAKNDSLLTASQYRKLAQDLEKMNNHIHSMNVTETTARSLIPQNGVFQEK